MLLAAAIVLSGYFYTADVRSLSPRINTDNACEMMVSQPSWYAYAKSAEQRWGTPVASALAIIDHESSFEAYARPPRTLLYGFLPGKRRSSAYGYSQALDGTWSDYKASVRNQWAKRTSFRDSVDFIGWYNHQSKQRSEIHHHDAYNQYLAYHEGHAGYNRRSYKDKEWLVRVATELEQRRNLYHEQLENCRELRETPQERLG
ncbi:hypothetical protein A3709_19830 [Halioglobus sp. HI00S01]|nr:hypothetical protein A3709_19830 [Halioglobus sp. HI00S01]